jgi:hypothetical protein
MQAIVVIVQDLMILVGLLIVSIVVLAIFISYLPHDNPLKQILTALSLRVCATLAAGVVAIPIEPIPGIDAVYDLGVPALLLWFWWTFLRDAYRIATRPGSKSLTIPVQRFD